MSDLQQRTQAFLERPVPAEINYAPGSIAEMFIHNYATEGEVDSGLIEIGDIVVLELDEAIAQRETPEAREYFQECKALVEEILAEVR